MAIRVLLDHGVHEERIVFLALLVAKGRGVEILRRALPKMAIVTGAIDDFLYETHLPQRGHSTDFQKVWVIQPGLGNIGERSRPSQSYFSQSQPRLLLGDRYYL